MSENVENIIDFTSEESEQITLEFPIGNVEIKSELLRVEENLIGEIDGINKVFTTTDKYLSGTTQVFVNGLKQKRGSAYTESGEKEITFSDAPSTEGFEDELIINYVKE